MSSQTGVLVFQSRKAQLGQGKVIYERLNMPSLCLVLSVSLFNLHLSQCMCIILEFWKHSTALLRWRNRYIDLSFHTVTGSHLSSYTCLLHFFGTG